MLSMTGVVTIVQEGRFQLLDEEGVSHQFLLKYNAAAEPEQLPALLNQRVRVSYTNPYTLLGHVEGRIMLLDAE